eukprot:CAMPEP_0180803682 /NCGR_PEP_ID=MMETSP1038_2-20121128/61035_1 /TAXON_ID=632150 /ORGANISM="Azadinium spinosum, Strain 3D9" /LENGTH=55 /DNA_ID=CAMNT_0022844029 /DNA_START=102 /DNA_END=265 /DNA_ORIENTATION=+
MLTTGKKFRTTNALHWRENNENISSGSGNTLLTTRGASCAAPPSPSQSFRTQPSV